MTEVLRSFSAIIFFVLFSFISVAHAQKKTKPPPGFVVGTIQGEDPIVYREADFDSKPWFRLKNGKKYWVSRKLHGPFHQIQVRPGALGFIPDNDVLLSEEQKKADQIQSKDKEKVTEARSRARLAKPFINQAYQGVGLHMAQFKEDTMGAKRSDNVLWLGYQLAGENALLEGSESDAGVMLGFSAPKYYEEVTGNSARGYSFIGYVVPQYFSSGGANQYTYFGIGPFLRYSHVETQLMLGSKKQYYGMDEFALGLLVQLGAAIRLSRQFNTRLETRYYFDRQPYLGFSVSFLFPFDSTSRAR